MPRLAVDGTTAHLWYASQDEVTDTALVKRYEELLTETEAAQYRRYATLRLQREYLVTRALCRFTLSCYADVAPADWRFTANSYGRPEIDWPNGNPPVRFNLSNTGGLIACLVTASCDAGVDVEDTSRRGETVSIADRFFSPSEVADLNRQGADRQTERFFEYWTLKEAYIKARGMGLSLPLDQFSFHLDEAGPVRISFASGIDDDPAQWQFALYRPTARHLMATAIKRGPRPDMQVELRPGLPGMSVPP